jgi:hypothetical protein
MNWYITRLVFRVHSGNGNHTPQFDEQVRLIKARSANEAFLKARMIGGREEDIDNNETSHGVRWQFIDVCELKEIHEFSDGLEICSRIHETDNAQSYIDYIHHRAESIEQAIEPSMSLVKIA